MGVNDESDIHRPGAEQRVRLSEGQRVAMREWAGQCTFGCVIGLISHCMWTLHEGTLRMKGACGCGCGLGLCYGQRALHVS